MCQKKWIHRKETPKTWISRKKIVVAFILGDYSGLLLKSSFNSVLPRLLFFLSLSNVFFLYHSFPPYTSASVRRKGSPSSPWRWRRRCYCRPVDTFISVGLLWQAGLWHGSGGVAPVETCLKIYLELPKSRYLIFLYSDLMNQFEGSRRFDDH